MKNKTLSKERILGISNDISEDMCKANREELIQVVRYFRDELDKEVQKRMSLRSEMTIAVMTATNSLLKTLAEG